MNTDSYSHHTQHKGYRPKFKNKKKTIKHLEENSEHKKNTIKEKKINWTSLQLKTFLWKPSVRKRKGKH